MVTASGKSRWTSVGDLGQLSLNKLPPHLPGLDLDRIDTVVLGRTQDLGLDIHWYLSFLDLHLDLFPDLVAPEIKECMGNTTASTSVLVSPPK